MDQTRDFRNLAVGIEATLKLTKMRVSRLRDFHYEGEAHFRIGFNDLEIKTRRRTPTDWEEFGDFCGEQHDELEELRDLKRNFSILGLFTVLEMFMQRALLWLHWPSSAVPPQARKEVWDEIKKRLAKKNLDRMKDTFRKIGVPIAEDNPDWPQLMEMKLVRNCIAHSAGHPDEDMVEKLEKIHEIRVVDSDSPAMRIELSKEYFGASADLVERICDRIAKRCYVALKENRVRAWRTISCENRTIKYLILT